VKQIEITLISKDFAQLNGAPGTIKSPLSPSIEATVLSGCLSAAKESIRNMRAPKSKNKNVNNVTRSV
jgi:hypothetical protein